MSAKLMEHSLKKLNYRTVIASNGKEALNILVQDASIKLVITDVMMPEIDGLELLEWIKKRRIVLICLLSFARYSEIKTVLNRLQHWAAIITW